VHFPARAEASSGTEETMNRIQQVEAIETPTGAADGELLARFLKRRDDDAFAELLTRHGAMVFGVCLRRLGQSQDAEDAFQAVFLALSQQAAELVDRPSVGPWLYTVARRVSGKALRGRRRRRWVFWGSTPEPATEKPAEVNVDLDAALASLNEQQRSAVILCHLEGLSRAEAAKALAIPEGTLSARLSRALEKLRRKLGKPPLAVLLTASLVMLPERLPASTVELVHHHRDGALDDWASPQTLELYRKALPMRWLDRFGPLLSSVVAATLILVGANFGWQMLSAQPPSGGAEGEASKKEDQAPQAKGLDGSGGRVGEGDPAAKAFFGGGRGSLAGMEGGMGSGEMTLADAVKMFNDSATKKEIGKTQPPLTEHEVVAAIRGMNVDKPPSVLPISDELYKVFQEIAEFRKLPKAWSLRSREHVKNQGFEFDVWRIDLEVSTKPGSSYTLRIRDQWIRSRPIAAQPVSEIIVVPVKNVSAEIVVDVLNRSIQGKWLETKAYVDQRTNSVIIQAPKSKQDALMKTVQSIDELHK
jgi:RNA polymerase sigma factor (sigma-70 family)